MFYRILKKDLKHKRGINVILFIFMVLATVFVASSVNNIIVISNARNYCLEKGQVADEYVSTFETEKEKKLGDWLDGNKLVKNYTKNEALILSADNIVSFAGKEGAEYNINGMIMLHSQWKKNMLIFDKAGKLVKIREGEIGMQQKELDRNGLQLGDTITVKFGDIRKVFRITTVIMDPAFGGEFVGSTRYIISSHDFQELKSSGVSLNYNYNINTYDKQVFYKAMNREAFNIIVSIDKDMFAFSYVMSMIIAGILIIVGICLILIAFLILRFTIVFTLQENYKEIGIMKAIGIKNLTIKKIYLVKYFALVSVASILGCFISIPVSNRMLQSVSQTIMMENASVNFGINIVCSFGVAMVVMLLCYLCTNKLRKFSAMEAIKSGQTGERFRKKSAISLHKSKSIKTPLFLAVNDILSNLKRYIVLILTFVIGTIIIILPNNAITSLNSKEMAKNFELDLNADFYARVEIKTGDGAKSLDKESLVKHLNAIKDNFKHKNYDMDVNSVIYYSFSYYSDSPDSSFQIMTNVPIGSDGSFVQLLDGTTPIHEDEIALSEKIMDKMGVKIGDTLYAKIGDEVQKFIITASYQNFMNMGQSALMSANAKVNGVRSSGNWFYQCYLKRGEFNTEVLNQIRKDFPNYNIYNLKEAVESQLGSTASQLENIKISIVFLVCLVNIMITALMMKIFIMSEKGQIAMLRSIGYSLGAIRRWQVLRIGVVLLIGVFIGELLSIPLNGLALSPIFAMMGATHMEIQINPLEVYVIEPLLLLLVISVAAYISSGSIRKLKLMEINNAE